MGELILYGGKTLEGRLRVQGSKNAVLPILAATLLTDECCEIENCPDLTDVHGAFAILSELGCRVEYDGTVAKVCAADACGSQIPNELMRQMRSSIMFLGPILGRCRKACISYPGGCALGTRPIDIHLDAMNRLGVCMKEEDGYIYCRMEHFIPRNIPLMFPSVGATENLMLLCAVSPGETILINPAREPEIVDLQNFLNAMGANISGAGTDSIRICGVSKLHGCRYRIIPDRIVAATYAAAAVACGGEIELTQLVPSHLHLFWSVLQDMGATLRTTEDGMAITMRGRPKASLTIRTLPYPGFPTDIQPIIMAAALQTKGTWVIAETIFENRFKQVAEFMRMGADIQIEGMNAIIRGVDCIHGTEVYATDLRGGAALTIAGLSAKGCTRIHGTEYIHRGYENFASALRQLGAVVEEQ